MAKRNSRKRKALKPWQIAVVAVLVVVFAVVALNERMEQPFLPTWEQLFSAENTETGTADPAGELRVTVIDVGNADSILVQSGDAAMLIDAGERGDGDLVLNTLRQNGVTTLDHVIATHADSDHIGGMKTVLEGVTVNNYIMAFMPEGHTPTTKTYMNVLTAIDEKNIQLTEAKAGDSFALGEAQVNILGPVGDFEDNNNQSVICKVTFGEKKFLFMGDAEKEAEAALLATSADLSADFIKVGHHGSRTGTSKELLARVQPKLAMITCGNGNAYGHPHAQLISRLQAAQLSYYRSDVNGTVTLLCDGKTITVSAEKGEAA